MRISRLLILLATILGLTVVDKTPVAALHTPPVACHAQWTTQPWSGQFGWCVLASNEKVRVKVVCNADPPAGFPTTVTVYGSWVPGTNIQGQQFYSNAICPNGRTLKSVSGQAEYF